MKQKLILHFFVLFFILSGCISNNNLEKPERKQLKQSEERSRISNNNLEERIKGLNAVDYSAFKNLSVTRRKGVYVVVHNRKVYFVKRYLSQDEYTREVPSADLEVPSADLQRAIGNALDTFENMPVQAVSVDSLDNIEVVLSVERNCTHFLYKPSNSETDSLCAQKYEKYDSEWYFEKVCSE